MMQEARSQPARSDQASGEEGRLGSSGSPPEHARCPGAAGYGGEACHIALQLQIPAAQPTPPPQPPRPTLCSGAAPGRRRAKPVINRCRLLNGTAQVAADHIPVDCTGTAAALPGESPSSIIKHVIASFSLHVAGFWLSPGSTGSTHGGGQGARSHRHHQVPVPLRHLDPLCPGTCHGARGLQVCPPVSGRAVRLCSYKRRRGEIRVFSFEIK